jgi:hypothetical protein
MAMVCVQGLRKTVAQSPMRVKIQLVDQILMIEIYSSLQVSIANGVSRTALNFSVFDIHCTCMTVLSVLMLYLLEVLCHTKGYRKKKEKFRLITNRNMSV